MLAQQACSGMSFVVVVVVVAVVVVVVVDKAIAGRDGDVVPDRDVRRERDEHSRAACSGDADDCA